MKVSFSEKGSGFPVVLIHGFCETRQVWSGFVEFLSERYRVLTPDLPGFGESPLPEGDFSIDDVAEIMFEWIKSLELSEVAVVGHSLGGYVTLALAKKHPEILRGFGLFHSTALADSEEKKDSRNKTIDFVKSRGADVFARSFVPQLFYYKNRKRLAKEIEAVVEIAAATPDQTLIQYTKAMRDRKKRLDVLKSFPHPILIIAGDNDTAVPLETIGEQELLPKKSIVHIYDDTGHMGMFEQKMQTLGAVEDFLAYCL